MKRCDRPCSAMALRSGGATRPRGQPAVMKRCDRPCSRSPCSRALRPAVTRRFDRLSQRHARLSMWRGGRSKLGSATQPLREVSWGWSPRLGRERNEAPRPGAGAGKEIDGSAATSIGRSARETLPHARKRPERRAAARTRRDQPAAVAQGCPQHAPAPRPASSRRAGLPQHAMMDPMANLDMEKKMGFGMKDVDDFLESGQGRRTKDQRHQVREDFGGATRREREQEEREKAEAAAAKAKRSPTSKTKRGSGGQGEGRGTCKVVGGRRRALPYR